MRAVKILHLEGGSIGPRTEKLRKLWQTYLHGTVFPQKKYLYQKEATVWTDQKSIPLIGAMSPLTCTGRQNTPSQRRQYRAHNVKFGKLGRTYGHGTMFAPRKYLYHKEAAGMERPEMYSVSQSNNPT